MNDHLCLLKVVEKRARDELIGSMCEVTDRRVETKILIAKNGIEEVVVIVTKSEGRPMQLLSLTPYLQRLGQHHDIDFKIDNDVGSLPVGRRFKKSDRQDGPQDTHRKARQCHQDKAG
jgi:hypothetical protein